jgi:hypothetical protein
MPKKFMMERGVGYDSLAIITKTDDCAGDNLQDLMKYGRLCILEPISSVEGSEKVIMKSFPNWSE